MIPATLCVFIYRAISVPTTASVLKVAASKIPWRVTIQHGDALISRARSVAATMFLDAGSDVLVMTDDDFLFTNDGLEALVALARETKGIVAGVTPLKSGAYTAIVPLEGTDTGEPWRDVECKPKRVRYAGGLIAYHREVFEKMAKTLPLLHQTGPLEPFYPFFMPMVMDTAYLSEDYACHERAQQLGIEVWVEPKCQVGHLASHLVVTMANMDRIKDLYI